MYNEKRNEISKKYQWANYSRHSFSCKKEIMDYYKAAALEAGMSFNGFIKAALDEKILRDGIMES